MTIWIPAAAFFLPLFPLSVLFNLLFEKLPNPLLRILVLLAWPQIGIGLLLQTGAPPPAFCLYLALATSLFYGFRALVLRELIHWISFFAISTWATLWLVADFIKVPADLHLIALGLSLPLGILTLLGTELEKQFGASYSGLYNGLGHTVPRFSGVFVVTILAIIATPAFPGFTAMAAAFLEATAASLVSCILLCLIWLTWGWAGARLIQGFVIGKEPPGECNDLSPAISWVYSMILAGLAAFGIYTLGHLS